MNTVLQFGGGKDSLACLYLLRPVWDDIMVCWLNTGAAFPETENLMESIKALVPHFMEVRTDVLSDIGRNGWPVDVLPTAHTALGSACTSTPGLRLRSWADCCGENFWKPLDTKMREMGVTTIIRGQRAGEHYKSPIRDGHEEGGITYRFPLQDWSEDDVFAFLRKEGVEIPEYYAHTGTSLDCWNCTAFLDAKLGQLEYMRERHPEKHQVVRNMLREIAQVTAKELAPLRQAIDG